MKEAEVLPDLPDSDPPETFATITVPITPALGGGGIPVKEGRRNSGTDMANIQSAHDAMVAVGAKCSPDNMPEGDAPAMKDATAVTVPEPVATLIGVKAAEPVPNVDLDAMREALSNHAIKVARDLLR